MPTTYACAFTVPAGTTGGRLSGGFAGGARPTLQNGDRLAVSVSFQAGDSTAPVNQLNGIFVYTAAADAPSNQADPSPFVQGGGNFICAAGQFAAGVSQGSDKVFTFAPYIYNGGRPGSYELTFVAINDVGTAQYQWSEDPEFETGN